MSKTDFGDKIKIITSSEELEGIYVPSLSKDILVLKLKSGYNIGIERKKIKSIKLISKYKKPEIKHQKISFKDNLKTISILHTGGTIASQVSYETGGVIARFSPEEIISMFPELQDIVNIKSRLISNMWSEDMNFNHYNLIAKEIEKEVKEGIDGIIITHGTDTLGITAAALTFILENLSIPVILVGSQRSSDRGSADAKLNLLSAANFIAKTDFQNVAVCMHETTNDDSCLIMPSLKTRKLHSSSRGAFKIVNDTPIARISSEGHITFLKQHPKKEDKKLNLKLFNPKLKIGILKSHPNMSSKEISNYKGFDALILEGYGLAGNFPVNEIDKYTKENKKIFNEIRKLANKMPIIATSQTIFGRINMNVYSTGRLLQEFIWGNNLDMLTETAFIKISWLLSNYPKNKIKELFHINLRGEISKRSEIN